MSKPVVKCIPNYNYIPTAFYCSVSVKKYHLLGSIQIMQAFSQQVLNYCILKFHINKWNQPCNINTMLSKYFISKLLATKQRSKLYNIQNNKAKDCLSYFFTKGNMYPYKTCKQIIQILEFIIYRFLVNIYKLPYFA